VLPASVWREQKLPGVLAGLELDNAGMHTTDTIDFEVILWARACRHMDATCGRAVFMAADMAMPAP